MITYRIFAHYLRLSNLGYGIQMLKRKLTVRDIRQAKRTGSLDLSYGGLAVLPAEIFELAGLGFLNIGRNSFTALPPEVGQLTSLGVLEIYQNELTALPPEIGLLTKLRSLDLRGNQLGDLPPEIAQLTGLRSLDLRGNQFTALPREVGQLTGLHSLDLRGNQLVALPREIGRLAGLQVLDVRDNQLADLPRELADLLSEGLIVRLDGNPLREPIPELAARGPETLAAYLRSLDDATPQYQAKVLLVGEGNVGKTSLIAALRDDPFIEGRLTTHGIEIQPLTLRHPDLDVEMTVRAWDFGGQEVYRVTHQFFFSKRALYLVVWNPREGQEQNEVEGWLRRIRLRVAADASALLVATHCDERRPELDFPNLKREFPELVVSRHEVDNRTGNGIAEIRAAIAEQAARLPQMGQMISKRWIAARDEILARARSEPQISYQAFARVCRDHRVAEDEIATLAELLHDLGQIIYYGADEGLRDFVVLNPEWLTKAISYVLEDTATRLAEGILDHARLRLIWRGRSGRPGYPQRYHPYFLRLMEKFDVSYRLENEDRRSLVAQLVPHDRPDLPWDWHTRPQERIRQLSLICRVSEPVPGMIPWLTVRHHRASVGKHWRTGVFLRHPISSYASEALLELRAPTELALDVRAPSPDLFFNVLRDSVEDLITRRWPGLRYDLLIPCPERGHDGRYCRGRFPLKGLQLIRERGQVDEVPCMECGQVRAVSALLTGFALPDAPIQPQLDRLQRNLAEMRAGVARIEGYAADAAEALRRVLRAVSAEITDCPRLFTLTSRNPTGAQRIKKWESHYRLVLWCEHQGSWHPWSPAAYDIDQPREWLIKIGPYAALIVKTLQLVGPIASSVAGVILPGKQLQQTQNDLQLMTTLVAALPDPQATDNPGIPGTTKLPETTSQLTPLQGEAARMIRVLLFKLDPRRAFGDLRRMQAPSGEFVWVCPDHYSQYDPGLPTI